MIENNEATIVDNLRIFGEVQKTKAMVNMHKQHWSEVSLQELLEGLQREIVELEDSIDHGRVANAQLECADIANYAAMIFDKIRNGND